MRKIALKKPPIDKVKEMKDNDLSDEDIVKTLRPNFSNQEIDDAFSQASQRDDNILSELDQFEPSGEPTPEDLLEETPSPETNESSFNKYAQPTTSYNPPMPELNSNQVQEIVESIVDEKWEDMISKVGDINLWKESVNNDIEAIKQEVLRVQERFNNLQNIMTGKVQNYNKSVVELSSEMKALEQVMQKIIEPLTTNVKELSKITSELKKKKST